MADCRLTVFPFVSIWGCGLRVLCRQLTRGTTLAQVTFDVHFWIKGEEFTVDRLLGYREHLGAVFRGSVCVLGARACKGPHVLAGGSMAIFRLAPADYHRTHAPVSGTVTEQYTIESTYYSVNADAIRAATGAIFNQRVVTILRSDGGVQVAFVAIGATCVGSVEMQKGVGGHVERGEDFSNFQFGGRRARVRAPRVRGA